MKTREEYDKIITDMQTALGDDFSKISSIVADLSTDYDAVIQGEKDFQDKISKLNSEKVELLENNNKLFTQVTNKQEIQKDPVVEQEEKKETETININDIVDENGGM